MTDRTHPDSGRIITSGDILLHDAKTALMYEELRAAIDDGHESMTHADALVEIAAIRAENVELRTGYAAARLEIESLQARIKTMAEEHADELMVAHLDGRMRAEQPIDAMLGEQAELRRLSDCCPELNLSNYGPDDVDELNGWAIEVSQCIDRALAAQPTGAQQPGDERASHGQAPAQEAPAAVAGPHVTDAMALAFHSALSDGAIGSDEVEETKAGLRAALAAAPAQPAPQQEPSYTAVQLAELVLSDCGHSSNYTPLLDRVAARIDSHTERRLDELRRCLESKPAPQQEAQEPVAWYVTGCSRLLDEDEAKAEARHIGGTARAIPLYTAPQTSSAAQGDALQPIVALQEQAGMYADDFAPQAYSVTAPAATVIKKGAERQWMSERLGHLPDGIYSLYLAPPAQAADSVLEDAARYRYLRDVPMELWPAELLSAIRLQQNAKWDAAIDAARAAQEPVHSDGTARKQGENHD